MQGLNELQILDALLLCLVALFGAGTLVAVFRRMKGGFGPYNLRAVGLVLIATFAALLAVKEPSSMTASMGILGTIAGYLFGMSATPPKEPGKTTAGD